MTRPRSSGAGMRESADGPAGTPAGPEALSPALWSVLTELPGIVLVVDEAGRVQLSSQQARDLRLIRRGRLASGNIADRASETIRRGRSGVWELTLRRPPMRKGVLELRVRGIPLPGQRALLLLDDLTEERRVATVRRDFIANVSHELKTPVGAVSLLAEAIVAASDNPEEVQYFARRMQTEAQRLANLINDVIDLSRLQGDDPLSHAEAVQIDDLVTEAIDFIQGAAEAKQIETIVGGVTGCQVYGDHMQLETALRNVLANAVAYSEPRTKVAVAVRAGDNLVEIDVKDQGIGIPENELGRIFERFYRVDDARSRVTGGTGLGLAIVRNVCHNHGGDVRVWSVEGEGSTFTLQFPAYSPTTDDFGPADEDVRSEEAS